MSFPVPIELERYLHSLAVDNARFGFLCFDDNYLVVFVGGDCSLFTHEKIRVGVSVLSQFVFLEGLLPCDDEPVLIENTQLVIGQFTDFHLLRVRDGQCVLALDKTHSGSKVQQLQQERLDRAIKNENRHAVFLKEKNS